MCDNFGSFIKIFQAPSEALPFIGQKIKKCLSLFLLFLILVFCNHKFDGTKVHGPGWPGLSILLQKVLCPNIQACNKKTEEQSNARHPNKKENLPQTVCIDRAARI
jgi:hypothetical protein